MLVYAHFGPYLMLCKHLAFSVMQMQFEAPYGKHDCMTDATFRKNCLTFYVLPDKTKLSPVRQLN